MCCTRCRCHVVGPLPHFVEEIDPEGAPTFDQALQLRRRRSEHDGLHNSIVRLGDPRYLQRGCRGRAEPCSTPVPAPRASPRSAGADRTAFSGRADSTRSRSTAMPRRRSRSLCKRLGLDLGLLHAPPPPPRQIVLGRGLRPPPTGRPFRFRSRRKSTGGARNVQRRPRAAVARGFWAAPSRPPPVPAVWPLTARRSQRSPFPAGYRPGHILTRPAMKVAARLRHECGAR